MSQPRSKGSSKALDKKDNRKFFITLVGVTLLLLVLLYVIFINSAG